MSFPTKVTCLACGATGPFPCYDTGTDETAFEIHGRHSGHGMFKCRACSAFNLMKFRLLFKSSFVEVICPGDPRHDGIVRKHAELFRQQAQAHYDEGIDKSNQGDASGAIAAYSAAVEADATFFSAYIKRGVAYLLLDQGEQALSDFEAAHAIESADWDRSYVEASGDFETKESFINATEAFLFLGMGLALQKCQKFEQAVEKYKESYSRDPAGTTLVEMGKSYRDADHRALAADCFREYINNGSPSDEESYPIDEVKRLLASVT